MFRRGWFAEIGGTQVSPTSPVVQAGLRLCLAWHTTPFPAITPPAPALTGADVEPVGVVRRELLLGTGLDDVDPGRDLELARALKVGRVGLDEVLSAVCFDADDGEGIGERGRVCVVRL